MTTSQQAEDRRQARCIGKKWTLLASVVDLKYVDLDLDHDIWIWANTNIQKN